MTNAAKHSKGDTVWVSLEKKDSFFEMHIKDNGKMEAKNYKTTGLGLSNMEMRAGQINATFEVVKDEGYELILSMKSFL